MADTAVMGSKWQKKFSTSFVSGELDDELMSLLAAMLEKEPDIYSYWALRRQRIESLREVCSFKKNSVIMLLEKIGFPAKAQLSGAADG